MAQYQFGADIKADVLFRGGEPTDGTSDYDAAVKDYIQRVYWEVFSHVPWPWAKKYPPGVVQTVAKVTGTATVTNGSTNVTLTDTIAASMTNRKFRIDTERVFYRIAAHTAATATLTLDAAYTETTGVSVAFTIFQDEYQLATGVNGVIKPFAFWYRNAPQRMLDFLSEDQQRAVSWLFVTSNVPRSIAMITEDRIRIRPFLEEAKTIEYDYVERQSVLDFTGAGAGDTPNIPRDDRHVLSDWALFYLLTDKKDGDAGTHLVMVKTKLEQMQAKYLPQQARQGWVAPRQAIGGRV